MLAGDFFTAQDRLTISEAIRQAEQASRMEISVYVGPADGDSRSFATQLHNSLTAPSRTVVIMVDPARQVLEVVTGGWVRERLDDGAVQVVADQMRDAFAGGDLRGGIVVGVDALARHVA